MLRVSVSRVEPDQVDRLREWFATLSGPRRDEILATFEEEGVRHETVLLVNTPAGPLMVYALEEEDSARSQAVFQQSTHPVDIEHRQVLKAAWHGPANCEVLFDLSAD
ncbi:DUF6176 family protein [Sphaerisporangium sp. NPDC051017]|uniref:DUF6176 family protein n=1 Tax=Sphaerisporangium sp. NPDC051017 TaxID=3154636 RepID=UPI0034497824